MSTKTLRKRIALVAVSALGFGVLTSVSANAALPTGNTASSLYIATTASTTGSGSIASAGTESSASNVSVGWIADTSATAATSVTNGLSVTGGNVKTGTVYAGAKIAFVASATGNGGVSVVVTGGTLSSVATNQTVAVNGAATVATGTGTTAAISGVFTVSAAAGSTATISAYSGTDIAGLTTATSGALLGSWTLTVASASASGAYSAADSKFYQQACVAKSGTATLGSNSYDTTASCDNGKVGVIWTYLKDAYSQGLSSGTIYASATNGATVNVIASSSYSSDAFAATTSFDSVGSDAEVYVVVNQPVANVAGSTDVTISYNGSVIGTKTIKWTGDAASITVDATNSNASFPNDLSDTSLAGAAAGVIYVIKDAAGNAITYASQPTVDSATGAMVGATLSTSTAAAVAATQSAGVGYGYSTMNLPGNALSGKGSYRLKITNGAGVALYSAVQNVTVSRGGTNSFEAKWDKTAYKPGEIAVLTLTLKDEYGNPMAAGTALGGLVLDVATGLTSVGTACSATSTVIDGGIKTCKFAVGNDAGSYAYTVDMTTVNPQAATVGTVSISTGAVSNAEVLAAIVKLIASINKQIAALQKALKKK